MSYLFDYDDCNFMDLCDLGIDFQEDIPPSVIQICNNGKIQIRYKIFIKKIL